MAAWDLTTYAGLQAAVADTLNRQDLSDQITGFITMAEAKFNRELRVRDMQMRATATTDDEFIPVPGDYRAPHKLSLTLSSGVWLPKLTFVGEDEADDIRRQYSIQGYQGPPTHYTIYGGAFEVIPAPPAGTTYSYDLKYYGAVPGLSNTNTSNWLLIKSPDLYLYGACQEAAPYLKNDERLQTWGGLRSQIVEQMRLEHERAAYSQTALRARPRGF